MPEHQPPSGVDLRQILSILRRQAWVVVGCCALAIGVAVGLASRQERLYTAKASLLFRDAGFGQTLFGSESTPVRNPEREAATNLELVTLPVIAEKTAKRVGRGVTSSQVSEAIKLEPREKSDVVDVTSTDPRRLLVSTIANTFAEQYIDFRRSSDRRKISDAQRTVEAQIRDLRRRRGSGSSGGSNSPATPLEEQLASLQTRSEDLRILASLQNGNAELVQRAAVPTSASSPKPKQIALVALFGGLLLGLILALLREQLDRSIKTAEEAADGLQAPLVGVIPFGRALGARAAMPHRLSVSEEESFRMLHAGLRLSSAGDDSKVIIVTSALSGEGKTTVALYLAATAALLDERVLLIDGDLRRPEIHRLMSLPPGPGLPDLLFGVNTVLDDVLLHVPVAANTADERELAVLVSGNAPEHHTRAVSAERIASVIEKARPFYDRIIVDTPPATVVSDALTLMQRVPAVVLVVSRIGRATRDSSLRLHRQLTTAGAEIEGVVANCVSVTMGSYDYYYSGIGSQKNVPDPRDSDKKKRALLPARVNKKPPTPAGRS
jgi:capsular exopolysaccharide synthesis family protein